jgi:hypothetical protein
MTDHLRSLSNTGLYKSIVDPQKLAAQLESDMQSVNRDGHLHIEYDTSFARELLVSHQSVSQRNDSIALQRDKSDNFMFNHVEILNGNIGYVQFTGFSDFIKEAKPTISSAFRFVANSNAIIIDLRTNGGGNPGMVKQVASYFVQERTHLNDIYERRRNKTKEFWAEPEDADNMKLSMPVYILTSKHTFSAAEDFTYAMQANKRAVIVGDTTGGGAHPAGPVPIGQGFVVYIPFARSINPITKTDWEGTGILPDVPVAADEALIKAQNLILTKQLANTATDKQKRRIQWCIEALRVHDYDKSLNVEVLKTYAGEYDRFNVFVKDNELYLHDFVGRTFHLKPITQTLFLANDWLQLEFLSTDGKVSELKMLGKPGWVNVMAKSKNP